MSNLNSVFAAYTLGWAVFFVFYVSIATRMSSLRNEVERLKNSLNRGKTGPAEEEELAGKKK